MNRLLQSLSLAFHNSYPFYFISDMGIYSHDVS